MNVSRGGRLRLLGLLVLPEPAPEIIFLDFGDSSLDFELRVWTIHQVQTPQRLKSDLCFAIFDTFRDKGIEIPFPQRDLHLKSVSPQVSSAAPDLPTLLS